jgi:putative component of toxin-antitoxin plasmid stabilization module
MKEIRFYQHTNNKVPVVEWLKNLDKPFRIRIQDRLTRIEQDENFGDFKKRNYKVIKQLVLQNKK